MAQVSVDRATIVSILPGAPALREKPYQIVDSDWRRAYVSVLFGLILYHTLTTGAFPWRWGGTALLIGLGLGYWMRNLSHAQSQGEGELRI